MHLLESSLSLAREQGALLWEVRAATDLAKLLHGQRSHEAARNILAPLLPRLNEGLVMPDFMSARAVSSQPNYTHGAGNAGVPVC